MTTSMRGNSEIFSLLGRAMQLSAQFIMVLIVPKALPPEGYLQLNLVLPLAMLGVTFLFGWMTSSIHRHAYEVLDSEAATPIKNTVFAYYALFSGVLAGTALALVLAWPSIYATVPLLLAATALKAAIMGLLNAGSRHRQFFLCSTASMLVLCVFVLLCFLEPSGESLRRHLLTWGALDFCVALLFWFDTGIFNTRRWPKFEREIIARYSAYGVPLVANVAAGWVIALSDRFLLKIWLEDAAVAGYVLSYQLASSMVTVPMTFVMTLLLPRILAKEHEAGTAAAVRLSTQYFRRFVLTTPLVAVGGPVIVSFLAAALYAEYEVALTVIVLVLFAQIVSASQHFVNKPFELKGRTRVITTATVSGAVLNFAGNIVLIPLLGASGAAMATLLAYGLIVSLLLFLQADASSV